MVLGERRQLDRTKIGGGTVKNARAIYEAVTRLEEKLDNGHVTRFRRIRGLEIPTIHKADLEDALRESGYEGLIVKNQCVLCGQWIPNSMVENIRHAHDEMNNVTKLLVIRLNNRRARNV